MREKPDLLGWYPLHLAVRYLNHDSHVGNRIIIRIAHAFPEAAQCADPLMFTPVQYLLHANGDEELIRLLWDHAGRKDPFGFFPLHRLLRNKNIGEDFIHRVIAEFPDAVKVADPFHCFPFHIAMRQPRFGASLRRLLFHMYPWAVNHDDPLGQLPAYEALRNILLLDHSCEIRLPVALWDCVASFLFDMASVQNKHNPAGDNSACKQQREMHGSRPATREPELAVDNQERRDEFWLVRMERMYT